MLGANLFRDILASIRDIVGGRARDVEVLGQAGGMLMACATGTAVALEATADRLPPPLPPQL